MCPFRICLKLCTEIIILFRARFLIHAHSGTRPILCAINLFGSYSDLINTRPTQYLHAKKVRQWNAYVTSTCPMSKVQTDYEETEPALMKHTEHTSIKKKKWTMRIIWWIKVAAPISPHPLSEPVAIPSFPSIFYNIYSVCFFVFVSRI